MINVDKLQLFCLIISGHSWLFCLCLKYLFVCSILYLSIYIKIQTDLRTCPLANPQSRREQSWLTLRADTAPKSAPVALFPRQRRRAWLVSGNEIKNKSNFSKYRFFIFLKLRNPQSTAILKHNAQHQQNKGKKMLSKTIQNHNQANWEQKRQQKRRMVIILDKQPVWQRWSYLFLNRDH